MSNRTEAEPLGSTGGRVLPVALNIREASKYAGLSRSFLYKLFAQQALPRLKAGKRVLILKSDLDAYLQSLREAGN